MVSSWKFPWPQTWTRRRRIAGRLTYSFRDCALFLLLFLASSALCLMLRRLDPNNDTSYVAVIFLLEVFLTAFLTDGYVFGVLSAVLSVLAVDYAFTAPYWKVSFVITGFPLTFVVMLFISVATSMITSRARKAVSAAREAERQQIYANLLRAVSHDIRTPLTGIVGATNALLDQEENLTPQQRRTLLTDANEDAQWLIRVVENLLSITRLGAENTRLCKSLEAVEEVMEGAVAKFAKRYPAIQVKVCLPDELLLVPMDPLLIQQVLTNLMENAALHGGDVTCITVSLEQKDADWAAITVADNGRGIAPEKLATIFDGSANSGPRSDIKRNMGIGLSVCRTVILAHGGRISARNQSDGGACFRLELPMKEEKHEDQG